MTKFYPYTEKDLLEQRNNYMYTPFEGLSFCVAYHKNRADYLIRLQQELVATPVNDDLISAILSWTTTHFPLSNSGSNSTPLPAIQSNNCVIPDLPPLLDVTSSDILLDALIRRRLASLITSNDTCLFNKLIQRFEVTKKIYDLYGPNLRKGSGDFHKLERYAGLAWLCAAFYFKDHGMKYLNTLLKVNDLLISVHTRLVKDNFQAIYLSWAAIQAEITYVRRLMAKQGLPWN